MIAVAFNPHPVLSASLSAFAFGVLSGLGPCVAPRWLALIGLTHHKSAKNAALLCGGFTAGIATVYVAYGCISSLVLRAMDFSPYIYAFVAILLLFAGVRTLYRNDHYCDKVHRPATAGGAFFLGIASASIASPCCTPMLFAMLSVATQLDVPLATALSLVYFAIGSAAPSLVFVALTSGIASRWPSTLLKRFQPVHAALLMGIGAYFGVLA